MTPSIPADSPPAASAHWIARQLLGCVVAAGILLLLGAALTTLAAFGAQFDWRLELLCHFRVQYFWALTLATVMFVACRHWRLAGVSAAVAAVNLALIVPLYFGGDRLPGEQPLVRAMSINVHYLNRNYAGVLELVRRDRPDVLLLLEVTPEFAKGMSPLDSEYPFSRALPRYDAAGLALFSRLPIEQFDIRGRAEIGLPTFVAEIALPTGLLTLIGTHPASPGSADHAAMRNRQLTAIARWAREAPNPVMVLGDLNTTSWSPYFADLISDGELRDTRRGFGVQSTWPSAVPLLFRIPIDHCLVSSEIGVQARRVGSAVRSDHRPIVVDFWLEPR